jgi:uncharacterized damage-inducible protein DinB
VKVNMSERSTGQSEILADYADGPNRLEAAIAGLSATDLDLAPSVGGWTLRQIVHHLADGDDLWKAFIKQAIGNPAGAFTLEWYWQKPQDEWAAQWAYAERAIGPSLALLHANRAHIVQLLEHVPGAWEKSLRIRWSRGEEQEVSVGWVVAMQVHHMEGHLGDIARIREAHHF